MSSANNLFESGSKNAKWARIYVNDLETRNIDAIDLTADNLLVSGTANVNLLVSQTNVSAPNGNLVGNNLLLGDDDQITTWVTNTTQNIAVSSLKSQLDINIGGLTFATTNFFSVRFNNVNITNNSQCNVTFNLAPFLFSSAQIREVLANLNIETTCVAGQAIMTFTNIAVGNLPSAGAFGPGTVLSFNVLIC